MRRAQGSFDSRKGAPWSTRWATDAARAAPSDTAAGTYGSVSPLSPEAIRRGIDAQICPWCGEGPFKMLALHTNIAHGIDRAELRDLAEVRRSTSICSPEVSERMRRNLIERDDFEEMSRKGTEASVATGAHKVATAASKKAEGWREGAEAQRRKGRERREAKMDLAVKRFHEGWTIRDISREAKMKNSIVTEMLEERGCDVKGRARVMRSAAQQARSAERQQKMVARFRELGQTWAATRVVAAEFDLTHRGAVAALRALGEPVPDGRRAGTGCC